MVWFWFGLFGFLTSSSTTRLYRGRVPRLTSHNFTCCHTRDRAETMASISAAHIILTPTQLVESGRPQRELNPGPPHQESRDLTTELPRPPYSWCNLSSSYPLLVGPYCWSVTQLIVTTFDSGYWRRA